MSTDTTPTVPDHRAGTDRNTATDDDGPAPALPIPATKDGSPSSPGFAALALLVIVAVLSVGLLVFKAPLPLMMVIGFCVACVFAAARRVPYRRTEQYSFDSIRQGLQPVLIFVAVGAMIAAWILSGTVPTMIDLGLRLIAPSVFLPMAVVLCAITSFINGTNFGTVATIGLALMSVGTALGIPVGIAAGAILSGAIFGDKMSPVSDTTVMAAGLAGVPLIRHIRHMMWTTGPAFLISLVFFAIVGAGYHGDAAADARIAPTMAAIESAFHIGWIPLIPPLLVVVLLVLRWEAFPALAVGVLSGTVVAVTYQGEKLTAVLGQLWNGYTAPADLGDAAGLIGGGETGGALKLLGLAAIIVFALATVGALNAAGVTQALLRALESRLSTQRRLLPATLVITAVLNAVGGAVNFAVAMGITTLRPLYAKLGISAKNLSRAAEDSGNTTGPLIPWNATAVFTAGALGVSTATYLPWAVFCYVTPLISLLYALTGFTISWGPGADRRLTPDTSALAHR